MTELPDLNHHFQHAYSGSPAEYGAIEETISPEVTADYFGLDSPQHIAQRTVRPAE